MTVFKAGEKNRRKKEYFQMSNQLKIWQISLTVKATVEVAEVTQESVEQLTLFFSEVSVSEGAINCS